MSKGEQLLVKVMEGGYRRGEGGCPKELTVIGLGYGRRV